MIEYLCPHCQHRMEIPEKFAGERGTCTMCAIPFTVPASAQKNESDSQDIWNELHGGGSDPRRRQIATAAPGAPPLEGRPELQGGAAELPDFVSKYRGYKPESSVGPAFWAIAYIFPPVAIVWALALPNDHPQKKIALLAPFAWLVLLVSVLGGVQYIYGRISASQEREAAARAYVPVETEPTPDPRAKFFDVSKLDIGLVYRVAQPIKMYRYYAPKAGLASMLYTVELPAGGMFRIVNARFPKRNSPWYLVLVSDGNAEGYMWIHWRNLLRKDLEVIGELTFMNPVLPLSQGNPNAKPANPGRR